MLSGLGRDKVCTDKRIFKSLEVTEERPGRAGSKDLVSIRRHVESGVSQLCLQTVLRDAGTTRTSPRRVSTSSRSSQKAVISLCTCVWQVEAGSDVPSESKVDQRTTLPAENGLSHTPIIAPKPPSLGGLQPQPAGNVCKPTSHAEVCYQSFLRAAYLTDNVCESASYK